MDPNTPTPQQQPKIPAKVAAQHLAAIYQIARRAPATADEHAQANNSAAVVQLFIEQAAAAEAPAPDAKEAEAPPMNRQQRRARDAKARKGGAKGQPAEPAAAPAAPAEPEVASAPKGA